ncbi:hypothetical protein PPL_05932 [Heterostelium album PN500]|uniref:Seipin n=1 Tax=Heterostelium pallidum (strain ATCC 26659 / Pp 5 / PN500) TaxID=670386 RepID=D3BBR3_HETP5|nr:hypothetical protein PPL_05932 [Heterostelium album PN500]EFA81096.1 hypothetical protein PPL_05932 [Heterostelium album PN500]|eukprot:XP_020433214.1 hypothetical protein PPL_05932 [Heterostelium album PN500]
METFVTTVVRSGLEFTYKVASFFIRIWLLPLNSMVEWFTDRIKPLFDPLITFLVNNKTKLLRISIYSVLAFGLVGTLSLANYFIIYSYYVPRVVTEEPLYFEFGKKITAHTDIAVEFQRNKLYDVYLHLELPESPKNEAAGMFMACLEIENQDKWNPAKILNTCRPGILKYRSTITKLFRTFTYALTNLFGITEEKQIISIPMVENLLSKRFYQTISVNVNIQNPDIQIYKASLVFQAKLAGLEYYLYNYPYISFAVGFASLFIFWSFSTLFIIISLYLYRYFKNPPPVEEDLDVFPFDKDNSKLTDEEKKKKKELYSDLDEVLNPLPSSSFSSSSSSSSPHKSQYIWEEELKEIDSLVTKKKLQQKNDTNNNNYYSGKDDDGADDYSIPKIGQDITKSIVSPEVKIEKIEESSYPLPGSQTAIVNNTSTTTTEGEEISGTTPIVDDTVSSNVPPQNNTDSEESKEEDQSTQTTPTTESPSPPSSDGESYGNSGNLGHDEWQIVGSTKDDDDHLSTIRKRKI